MLQPNITHNHYAPSMKAGNITVTYELVTPDLARELLEGNTHNRSVNQKRVRELAALHGTSFWKETGDPIRITADGILVDGQHRLLAIVQSGVPVHYFIMRGVDLTAQEVIDTGSRRTLASMLQTRQEQNRTTLATAIKVIYHWEHGGRSADGLGSVPINVLLHFYDSNPGIKAIARRTLAVNQVIRGGAGAVALTMWLFDHIDGEDAAHFWDRVKSEYGHTEGDPISTLRKTLLRDAEEASANKASAGNRASVRGQTWRAAVIIKAWNAYRRGEQVYRLQFSPGGSRPEKFPEPI